MSQYRITEEKVREFLKNGEVGEILSFRDGARKLINTIENLGAEEYRELSLNGWDCDFWQSFIYEDKYILAYGCAFDGTANIEITDEEEA